MADDLNPLDGGPFAGANSGDARRAISNRQTWVVKVGSRVLTDPQGRLDLGQIQSLSLQMVQLRQRGCSVVLVSSGAVASGMGRLGLHRRPTDLAQLQAVAAVGQAHLIQAYERFLAEHDCHAAQMLLTASDLDDRVGYLNVRNTLSALLGLGALPIINENDTVAVDELRTTFGDNDRLAAIVAGLITRPLLVILSDVEGLYDRDPAEPEARRIDHVPLIDADVERLVRDRRGELSKGGMASKLNAARFVTASGHPVVIAGGRHPNVLVQLLDGQSVGTYFEPQSRGMSPRKRWIGLTAGCAGVLVVDDGAVRAICQAGSSLLPIGIQHVVGDFAKGDAVAIQSLDGREIARGLINYNAEQVRLIRGCRSNQIDERLGGCPYHEVVHRDNLTLKV
jgi:glutamate 5-kinase